MLALGICCFFFVVGDCQAGNLYNEAPTEQSFSETRDLADLEIKKGKDHLKQIHTTQNPLSFYEKALNNFETALKLRQKESISTLELEQTIVEIKKNVFLLQLDRNSRLYLPGEREVKQLQDIVETYKDNIVDNLQHRLNVENNFSPIHHFISAAIHEEKGSNLRAMEDYLNLSENNFHALECIEKAYALLETICNQDIDLQDRKDGIRMAFENHLALLSRKSPQSQTPTCFVCFNVEEKDVGHWLEKTLVPDLVRAGIKPLFCFRDLNPGQDLAPFQQLARETDIVMCVFTPDVKKKCQERQKAPTGIAQEIRIIQERFNDEDKFNKIFPIYLKGSRSEVNPTPYFEPIFGSKFSPFNEEVVSSEFNYFSNAFDLLFAMRDVSREESRKMREHFLLEVKTILKGNLDAEKIAQWRDEKAKNDQTIYDSIAHRISSYTQIVELPLVPKDFTGRKKELEQLYEACAHQQRVVITALGGMGKTALALKYGNDYKAYYQFVYFMTSSNMIQKLLELADDLHIPKIDNVGERLNRLRTALNRLEKEYLLIFDGIDEEGAFKEMEKYIPERGRCILLTSRMPEEAAIRGFYRIDLKPLALEDAIKYLLQATGSEEKEQALDLAEKLGRLPLALTHAAGYIRSRNTTIERYIELFDEYDMKLFEKQYLTLTKEEKTVLTTWTMSLDSIEKNHNCPFAKDILYFLSFLGQAPIRLDLIENWWKTFYPQVSKLDLQNALRRLCDYSIIDTPFPNAYHIHLLVQRVIRYQLSSLSSESTKQFYEQLTPVLIAMGNKWDFETARSWKRCKQEASEWEEHIRVWKENPLFERVSGENRGIIFHKLGQLKYIIGDYPQALRNHLQALEVRKKALGSRHLSVAESLNYIGLCYYDQGGYQKALEQHREAFEIRSEALGLIHSDVAMSLNNMGLCYNRQADYKKAFETHTQALEIRKQILGPSHSDVAMSLHNIGSYYIAEGDYEKAREQFLQAFHIWGRVLDISHCYLGHSFDNIGHCYYNQGNYGKALEQHLKALKIRKEESGHVHQYTAFSLSYIGRCYYIQGDYEKALEKFTQSLEIRETILRNDHPFMGTCLGNIGLCHLSQGNPEKAHELHIQALEIKKRALSSKHPEVAHCLDNMGLCYQKQGRYEEALELHLQALEIYRAVFDLQHPCAAYSLNNMGLCYYFQRDYEKAFSNFTKALEIWEKISGSSHPNAAKTLNNIGCCYDSQGDCAQAIAHHTQALLIKQEKHGLRHPETVASLSNLGRCYYIQGNYEKAIDYFTQALSIKKERLVHSNTQAHPDIAASLNDIGHCYYAQKENGKAIKFYSEAIKIVTDALGREHPKTEIYRKDYEQAIWASKNPSLADNQLPILVPYPSITIEECIDCLID